MWCRLKSGWLIPSEGAHAIEVLGLEAAARRRGTKCRSLQTVGKDSFKPNRNRMLL